MTSPTPTTAPSGPVLSLIAFSIALNVTMGQFVTALKIPLYLDMLGTVLCAALAGTRPAIITAVSSNILAATLGSPAMLFFAPVGVLVAWLSSIASKWKAFARPAIAASAGAFVGICAATLSAPISAYVFGGITVAGTDIIVALFRGSGFSLVQSTWLQGLTTDIPDKALSFVIVAGLLRDLPQRILRRFRPERRSATA
jgi:energy-coupling factor transport system substrate-specific component